MIRLVLVGLVLLLAGCGHRGSLPGHDGGAAGHGTELGSALVWLDVVCLVGAGFAAAAAVFVASTVKGFASIMWAICFGFLATLAGALVLGAIAAAIPWIVGGLVVLGGGVLGLHYWRRLVAFVQSDRREPRAAPVVAPPLPAQT